MARQPRFFRIPPNVTHAVRKVLLIANEAIKIVALPKVARSVEELVNLARRESLPALS